MAINVRVLGALVLSNEAERRKAFGMRCVMLFLLLMAGSTSVLGATAGEGCGRRMLIENIMRQEFGKEDGFIFDSGKRNAYEWRSWCWSFQLSQFRWVDSWRIAQNRLRSAGIKFDAWGVSGGAIIQIHKSQFEDPK